MTPDAPSPPSMLPYYLVWCVLAGLVIWLSIIKDGWQRLSARYATTKPATGKVWKNQVGPPGMTTVRLPVAIFEESEGRKLLPDTQTAQITK